MAKGYSKDLRVRNCSAERDRLKKELPGHNKGLVLGGHRW